MTPQNQTSHIRLFSQASGNGRHQSIIDQLHAARLQCSTEQTISPKTAVLLAIDEHSEEEWIRDSLTEILAKECRPIVVSLSRKPMPFCKAWELLNMGVEEVLIEENCVHLGEVLQAKLARWAIIDRILESERIKEQIVGSCAVWKKALRQVIEMACFSSAPVLILGESGVGKELIARLIHELDKRPDKQELVLLDCTTIVPELSGSEFFGHEKGSFTNAVTTRDGAFALADRGTLFLDEIGELPLRLQAELLRVSQEGLYKRVGSNMWKKTTFRLVSATNRDLPAEVEKGNFRQDLYYRIRTCAVRLPALRERKEDIPELAEYFLKLELKTDDPPPFRSEVLHYLEFRDYPGNVRELRQLIARIAYRHCGNGPITLGDIPEADRDMACYTAHAWQENGFKEAIRQALADGIGLKEIKRIAGDVAMELAVDAAAGNLQTAAGRLGVTDRLVQGWLKER
jgi:transcriptional regulator with GAF, ATPase, and Fis domain